MTDKELLELAAKAAGIAWVQTPWSAGIERPDGVFWNPLTNDGDALRLAVKLQIHIQAGPTDCWATTLLVTAVETLGNDPYAATRRAIVRAAAEVGKEVK